MLEGLLVGDGIWEEARGSKNSKNIKGMNDDEVLLVFNYIKDG